jgi:hypothetical protein
MASAYCTHQHFGHRLQHLVQQVRCHIPANSERVRIVERTEEIRAVKSSDWAYSSRNGRGRSQAAGVLTTGGCGPGHHLGTMSAARQVPADMAHPDTGEIIGCDVPAPGFGVTAIAVDRLDVGDYQIPRVLAKSKYRTPYQRDYIESLFESYGSIAATNTQAVGDMDIRGQLRPRSHGRRWGCPCQVRWGGLE